MNNPWPNPLSGHSPLVQWLNRLRDACRRSALIEGPDYSLDVSNRGTLMSFEAGGGSTAPASGPTLFLFVAAYDNYIVGQNAGGQLVQIAKPYKLRNSITQQTIKGVVWNISYPQNVGGSSLAYISRTKSSGTYSEYQEVDPPYLAAEPIYAVQVGFFTAGSILSIADISPNPAGSPVTWLEDNRDGRAWAAVANQSEP